MTTTLILFLASMFAWAGVSKLSNWDPVKTARDFDLPPWTVPLIRYIYVVELAVAVLLLLPATTWIASIAATVLLLIFTIVIAVSLLRGKRPNCNCFGSARPISASTLVARIALTVLAAVVVFLGVESTPTIPQGLELALILLAYGLSFKLMEQNGRLLIQQKEIEERIDRAGVPKITVPDFSLPNINGGTTSLSDLSADGSLLLIFSSAACSICDELMPMLEQLEGEIDLTLAVISTGTLDSTKKYQLRHVLIDQDARVSDAYHVHGTPAGALIHNGRLVEAMRFGIDDILSLVEQAKLPKQARGVRDKAMSEADKYDEEAAEMLPCLYGVNANFCTQVSCVRCSCRPAVAARLRDDAGWIEKYKASAIDLADCAGRQLVELAELRAEIERLRAKLAGLHGKIMNLSMVAASEKLFGNPYRLGHRDARHAAAELCAKGEGET